MKIKRSFLQSSAALAVAFSGLGAAASGVRAADEQKVWIDVGVFDAQGQPVKDLAAADFTLRVKGQPRKVVKAEFVAANPEDPAAAGANAEPRRWIVLAIDESSMFSGTEHEMRDVAARILDRITPADRITVLPLPTRIGVTTTFTADVNEAQAAVGNVRGVRLPELLHVEMTFGEAIAIGEENDSRVYSLFRNRACHDAEQRAHCLRALNEAAGAAVVSMQSQAKPVFVNLAQVIEGMRELPGSKTVIFLSGGTAFSSRWASVDAIAKRAAVGEVTVQSLLVEAREEARGRLVVQNQILDRRVFMERLELVSHATRGAVYRVASKEKETPATLDRLMQETTGWYRLQVEPLPTDAGESISEAAVSVARQGLTVRARPLLLRGTPVASPATVDPTASAGSSAGGARTPAAANGAAPAGSASPAGGSASASAASGASANAAAAVSVGPAALASLGLTLVPPFGRDQVLAPPVLGVFLDQLVARAKKPSASLTAAVAKAKSGDLAGATSDATLADLAKVDPTAASFLRGLSLFSQPTVEALEAAATQFRDALRTAPDFYPAAFYLGACYAAGHRDREAAGAWQTALITLSDVPVVYLVLTDAWLRLREPAHATDFLEEASERWPQDVALTKRRVPVALLSGHAADALATIDRLMADPARADADLLFAGICLLHDAIIARQTIVSADDDRARLQRYAEAYRAANGAKQADVARLLSEAGLH
jgi:VWFA-related protein